MEDAQGVKRVVGGEVGEDGEEDALGGRELRTKGESHRLQRHRRLNLKYSFKNPLHFG